MRTTDTQDSSHGTDCSCLLWKQPCLNASDVQLLFRTGTLLLTLIFVPDHQPHQFLEFLEELVVASSTTLAPFQGLTAWQGKFLLALMSQLLSRLSDLFRMITLTHLLRTWKDHATEHHTCSLEEIWETCTPAMIQSSTVTTPTSIDCGLFGKPCIHQVLKHSLGMTQQRLEWTTQQQAT